MLFGQMVGFCKLYTNQTFVGKHSYVIILIFRLVLMFSLFITNQLAVFCNFICQVRDTQIIRQTKSCNITLSQTSERKSFCSRTFYEAKMFIGRTLLYITWVDNVLPVLKMMYYDTRPFFNCRFDIARNSTFSTKLIL